ncbi:hypothetical protein C2E23DRAFT_860897 [Lenzites betulinus]|nr:hypothetical protein C2E23DRAFT_860897 [Lenzites betulinus]
MNSTSTDQAAAAAEIAEYIFELEFDTAQNYCVACVIALLVYHYITTLDAEVAYFWDKAVAQKGRVSFAWWLFFSNRYLPLVVYIYQTPGWTISDVPWRCAATVTSQYILEFSQYALWAGISSFRVHSLRRNRLLTSLVLLLGLFPIISDVVIFIYFRPEIDPIDGCVLDASRLTSNTYAILTALSYSGWMLSEFIVVYITFAATRHHSALSGALGHGRRSLSAVLFRHGLIYFVCVFSYHLPAKDPANAARDPRTITLLNIAQMIANLLSVTIALMLRPSDTIEYVSIGMTFNAPLTSILLTHFYFDLQATARPPPHTIHGDLASTSTYADASPTAYEQSFGIRTADLAARFAACDDDINNMGGPGRLGAGRDSELGSEAGSDVASCGSERGADLPLQQSCHAIAASGFTPRRTCADIDDDVHVLTRELRITVRVKMIRFLVLQMPGGVSHEIATITMLPVVEPHTCTS